MSETLTLDYQTITEFLSDFDAGKFLNQRKGQAFVNTFLRETDVITQGLFYSTDEKAILRMIWGFCK